MDDEYHFHNLFFADRTVPLHAMLLNCGREIARDHAHYRWDGMRRGNREFVIWQFTERGRGALDFDGVTTPQLPGDAMLLVVPEHHCYYLPQDSDEWGGFFISCYGSECIRIARECRRQGGVMRRHAADSPLLATARDLYRECNQGLLDDRYAVSAAAYRFMMALLADYGTLGTGDSHGDFIAKINDYCVKNLGNPISVEELARRTGYSRWHFSRLCSERLGCSPQRYIHELKMRMAIRLLQTTNQTVKEVAGSCGFEDPAYFCKVFRRIHRMSPGVFRLTKTEMNQTK